MDENKITVLDSNDPGTEAAEQPRLFTQEEVDRIIKKRLYERKAEQKATEDIIEERVSSSIAERTAALEARERKLDCRSYLIEKGYASELLDILDTSDVETFKNKADALHTLSAAAAPGYPVVRDAGEARPMQSEDAAIAAAFKHPQAHQPKDKYKERLLR